MMCCGYDTQPLDMREAQPSTEGDLIRGENPALYRALTDPRQTVMLPPLLGQSMRFDLRIILLTFVKVLRHQGVSH